MTEEQNSLKGDCVKVEADGKDQDQDQIWTALESEYIKTTYEEKLLNVRSSFATVDALWQEIAARLNRTYEVQRTGRQCMLHYQAVNCQTAAVHKRSRIQILRAVSQEVHEHETQSDDMNLSCVLEVLKKESNEGYETLAATIRRTMLEINEIKERNLERRHRELMELLDGYLKSNKEISNFLDLDGHKIQLEAENKASIVEVEKENTVATKIPLLNLAQNSLESADADGKCESHTASEQNMEVELEPQANYQMMRDQILEIHRRKMEDRLRKNRVALPLADEGGLKGAGN